MQKLAQEEKETHISIDRIEEIVTIDTSIAKDIAKCKKNGYTIVHESLYDDGSICSVIFKAPRRCITFRSLEQKQPPEEHKEPPIT